jgi:hypothetical protein
MSGVYLVNVLDVARSLGIDPTRTTPEMVANWLITEYLKARRGGFNYNPAIGMTFELFRGNVTADQAELFWLTNGNPKGRRQNVEAIKRSDGFEVAGVPIGVTPRVTGRGACCSTPSRSSWLC